MLPLLVLLLDELALVELELALVLLELALVLLELALVLLELALVLLELALVELELALVLLELALVELELALVLLELALVELELALVLLELALVLLELALVLLELELALLAMPAKGAKVPEPSVNALNPPLAMMVDMVLVSVRPFIVSHTTLTVACIMFGSDWGVSWMFRTAFFNPIFSGSLESRTSFEHTGLFVLLAETDSIKFELPHDTVEELVVVTTFVNCSQLRVRRYSMFAIITSSALDTWRSASSIRTDCP